MKRYLAELVGAFFLMLAVSLTGNPIAIGNIFMVMVYLLAPISGAHFNPAVTFALWMRGKCPTTSVPGYILAQVLGACLVPLMLWLTVGNVGMRPAVPGDVAVLFGCIEVLLSFVLCAIILYVMSTALFKETGLYGLILGFSLIGLASFSMGICNPAIAFGSIVPGAFFAGTMPGVIDLVIYLLLPFVGAGLAALKLKMYYNQH